MHKLLSPKISVDDLRKSESALTTFVRKTGSLYGPEYMKYNYFIFHYYFIFQNVLNILEHFGHGQHFLMKVIIAFYEI